MHPSVIAVFRKKNPNRLNGIVDEMFWHRDRGLLLDLHNHDGRNLHGLTAWAQVAKNGGVWEHRFEVRLDLVSSEFVFPENFRRMKKAEAALNRARNPWYAVIRKKKIKINPGKNGKEKSFEECDFKSRPAVA